jgi:1-acyl-sn-glycerol-3-phosphate acyltransferase
MGGDHMKKILDVSICYPDGIRSFWDFLCGGISRVRVHIEELPITAEHLGDYLNNERFREEFQEWVNRLWKEKDLRLSEMSV